ncbi:MAG: DUF6345 domain-containing protein [Saprospiraceae bacterium]
MKINLLKPESPFSAQQLAPRAVINGSEDYYGACSIEKFFPPWLPLKNTHKDAEGFMDYVTKSKAGNFWFKDSSVQTWAYEEANDNWQDTYGADSVMAFYHSGHGNMDSNGVFEAPMGAFWDKRSSAFSNAMSLGDEQVRYLFWSTCYSLRVLGIHNPVRTWHAANKGLRMIFGYETVSVDDPNYGKYFWEEWNKGKSFSKAWLDASWRISNLQSPSVCATGATAEEAQKRLANERFFESAAGSNKFYNWNWYNALPAPRSITARGDGSLPTNPLAAVLASTDAEAMCYRLAATLGASKKKTANIAADIFGNFLLKEKGLQITVGSDGRYDAQLAAINFANTRQLDPGKARAIAENLISDPTVGQNTNLVYASTILRNSQGGSSAGSGKLDDAKVVETIVEFRQEIDGLQTVSNGSGVVRVGVDNDGKVTSVHHSARPVLDLSAKARSFAPAPGTNTASRPATAAELEQAFAEKLAQIRPGGSATQSRSAENNDVLLQSEIGYDFFGNRGQVVARRTYELDMGQGFKKLYKLQVPLLD